MDKAWVDWMVEQMWQYGPNHDWSMKKFLNEPSKQCKGTLYDEWCWKFPKFKTT